MSRLERVYRAASAVCREAERRAYGDAPDSRFDVPIDMLLDLSDDLEAADAPMTSGPSVGSEAGTRPESAARQAS